MLASCSGAPDVAYLDTANGGNTCLETATVGGLVAVRGSTDPDGIKLAFTGRQWDALIASVKDGRLDRG
jgi:Domain of unknown function (DUF397)